MLKSIIILPDGTELTSGTGQTNNIRSSTLTECVNSGEELTLGSVCSNMLEATIQAPRGNLSVTAGTEITLFKETAGGRHQVGVFVLEKPTRQSANLLKIVGYDRVSKLDRDLTSWLNGLTGWPYSLLTFAGMVCQACGLTLVTKNIPNGDYPVQKIAREATGRQLMSWIGEVCCRFCRATSSGDIELAWYRKTEISIAPSGELFYFQKGLSFEDYQVAPIDAVQIRLADSEEGALWPAAAEEANCYIIQNNPILAASVTGATRTALQVVERELSGMSYTPCKISLPATQDIHAGDIVQITDINGVSFTSCVMQKKQKGQRDTLACTGSRRRDSSTAVNSKTPDYVSPNQAGAIAAQETAKLDQLELLKRLTKEWVDDGIYLTEDGKIAINASAVLTGVLKASLIDTDNLKVKAANIEGTVTAGKVDANEGYIGGWGVLANGLFRGTAGTDDFLGLYSQHPDTPVVIGGVSSANWRIVAGTSFGVTRDGHLVASGATISGSITARSGKIGPWSVEEVTIYDGTVLAYSGVALSSYQNGTRVCLTPEYLYTETMDSYGLRTAHTAKWSTLAAMAQ